MFPFDKKHWKAVVFVAFAACLFSQGKKNVVETGTINGASSNRIPPTYTFASPPSSPPTGAVYVFTDAAATGVCSGSGSALATCRWSGSAWQATSGGAGSLGTVISYTASHTTTATDCGNWLTFNGSSLTATLQSPPTNPCSFGIQNIGSSSLTIARNGLTINGASSNITVPAASGVTSTSYSVWTDGTNYFASSGPAGATGATGATGAPGAGVVGTAIFSAAGGSISNATYTGVVTGVTRSSTGIFAVAMTSTVGYTVALVGSDNNSVSVCMQVKGNTFASILPTTGFGFTATSNCTTLFDPALVSITVLKL